ncbi:diacylglycerol/polyprenol kinase family protein [Methanothrix sp.]|uniref:diacylglycerol/polyprenol kinase family protein n=1 Tax=Methanothrix sp. TaxID=90426 RepID=UPI0034E1D286
MDEYLRKTIHILFGLAISIAVLVLDRGLMLSIFALSLLVGFALSDAIGRGYSIPLVSLAIDHLEREGELPGKGALLFTLSGFTSLVLFENTYVFLSLLVLSLLDGVATIAGKNYGRRIIRNRKTLEGSLAGAGITFFVLLFLVSPLHAAIVTLAASFIELLSPIDDNLLIPPLVCLVLLLLG